MIRPRTRCGVLLCAAALLALLGIAGGTIAQRSPRRLPSDDLRGPGVRTLSGLRPDEALLFNGWGITPAGQHEPVSDTTLKMVLSPDGQYLAAVHGGFNRTGVSLLHVADKRVAQFLPLARAFNGIAFQADGARFFASGGNSGELHSFTWKNGLAAPEKSAKPAADAADAFLAGLAVHPANGTLYVCNQAGHEVWAVDPVSLARRAVIRAGQHPHSLAFGADRRHLYVSNWGGRNVSVIDTRTHAKVRDINVGIRPNDLAVGPDGRLFVACAGDNTVHVIQTRSVEQPDAPADPSRRPPEGVREILATSLYAQSPEGSTPDGVALSRDGRTLFVANADNNSVMVADVSDAAITRVLGFVPTGWYPTAVAVTPGDTLVVASGKGLQSAANFPAKTATPTRLFKPPSFDYIGRQLHGALSFIPRMTPAELVRHTEQVRRNSPYTPENLRNAAIPSDSCIPDRVGGPCPIKYVLYVIKENRTYDQVFGDFRDRNGKRVGNGDPNLVMFGENVAPNHHALAREYVLLDNLYCNGEVSVDGHSWCDAAIATDYTQRSWLMSYSGHGRIPGNFDMEVPAAGYLWDLCRRHGIPFRCYGEGAARVASSERGTWPPGRDMDRIQGWITDLETAEKTGSDLPRFMIMSLGEDHTRGTTPGANTPEACVASNDIALGRIVAAASKSRFWKEMAIFVIEDDAQNGPDHVDAHRTVGLVIGPWVKRGVVDSTLYTTASMIRTMELILGLPPLTQYDAGATPMFASFRKTPEATVYVPLMPEVDVNAKNPANAPGASECAAMDWSEYDRIPEDPLNRILWRAVKGPNVPYPVPIHRALFASAPESRGQRKGE